MADSPLIVDTRSWKMRIALAVVVLAAAVFAWYAVRWQIGSMLAELTPPSRPDANQISKYAAILAPNDPLAWWLAATTEKDIFTQEKIDASVHMFEMAVRSSPEDFRWWIELGRSYEQAGETAKAEDAFRRAAGLAPNYAYVHWQLGNFLIRQGDSDEAIAELKKATENNLTYRNQVFALAWNYFGNDASKVEALASDDPDVKASLAQFFSWHDHPDESLRIWNSLSDEEKARHMSSARAIAETMNEKRTFWQGVEFAREAGIDPAAQAETITNPGFENVVVPPNETIFGWKIDRSDPKAENSIDSAVKHSGSRSLRTVFRNYVKPAYFGIWQSVAAQPDQKYILRFWAKTEALKSGGPPVIEIVNVADDKIITVSKPIATGTNDWQEYSIDFVTPNNCRGIFVRISRAYCGDVCPLVGTLWVDDFELRRG